MNSKINLSLFKNFKKDIPASIIVFLVAVPLCLGIALASGAPLFSGIIAGIVGGIVVGALSGSQLGVSGPAAGLAVIVLTAINDLGSFQAFLLAVVIGGIFQLLLGYARAGVIGYYFPSSVIKGMLAGIGIIIILKQIPHALGYDPALSSASYGGESLASGLLTWFEAISPGAVIIALLSIFILVLWEQPFMKKISLFKLVQGPLVVVLLGCVLNQLFQGTNFALQADQIVAIPVASSFAGFLDLFMFPDFSQVTNPQIYTIGITIAIVASLETLLCLEATDKLDPLKRIAPPNQELKAQGIGNIISGLIGGLPITQVIVRSSTNIQSGGQTKMSAILHGVIMLLCAGTVPFLLNLIPLSSLAAILVLVGYKLAKPVLFKEMFAAGQRYFIPFMITILGIVFADLLIGIGIGMISAMLFIVYDNIKNPFSQNEENSLSNDGTIKLQLAQNVTFFNKAGIQAELDKIPAGSKVILDASNTIRLDKDVIELIENYQDIAKSKHVDFTFLKGKKTSKVLQLNYAQGGSMKVNHRFANASN